MPTWNLLSDTTVSGSSTTTISFTSISQSYTDLALFGTLKDDGTVWDGQSDLKIYFKDSGGNLLSMAGGQIYYTHGSTPNSYQYNSGTVMWGFMPNSATSYTGVGPQYLYVYDYSSTTVAKNAMWLNGITGQDAQNDNNTWQAWRMCMNDSDDDPISQIDITTDLTNNFVAGATMSLYGITA